MLQVKNKQTKKVHVQVDPAAWHQQTDSNYCYSSGWEGGRINSLFQELVWRESGGGGGGDRNNSCEQQEEAGVGRRWISPHRSPGRGCNVSTHGCLCTTAGGWRKLRTNAGKKKWQRITEEAVLKEVMKKWMCGGDGEVNQWSLDPHLVVKPIIRRQEMRFSLKASRPSVVDGGSRWRI